MAVGRVGDRAAGGQGAAARRRPRNGADAPLRLPGPGPAGARRLGRRHRPDPERRPRRRPRRRARPEGTPPRAPGPAPRPVLRPRRPRGPVRDPPRARQLPGRDQRNRGIPEHRRPEPAPRPQVQVPLVLPARRREGHRDPHRPRRHHHGQHASLTSNNTRKRPEGNLAGPWTRAAPARHAALFGMPTRRKATRSNRKQELPTTGQTSKARGIASTPAAPLLALTFRYASHTSCLDISNDFPDSFSSVTRLLPDESGWPASQATDDP